MFGLRRCISAAKVTNLFTATGYLTPATRPCLKFLSSETDLNIFGSEKSESDYDQSKNLFIRSGAFTQKIFRRDKIQKILKEVCGTDYIPKIYFRGKKSVLVGLRSSEEAKKLLVGDGGEKRVAIGDHIFWIDPSRTREQETERYTERHFKRVAIRGIPESTSDDNKENKEHSLKAVEIMLNHLGSKCQVEFVRPMGKKTANRNRPVLAVFPTQEDVQSLLSDGKVKTFKIGEKTLHIEPFLPKESNNEERSRN